MAPSAPPTPCTPNASSAVVIAERLLDVHRREIADGTRGDADDQRPHRIDEARRRGDGHETSHRARDDAENAGLLGDHPFGEHPGERGRGRGDLRRGHGHAGIDVGGHRRAGIEAEPADPQQRGADHDEYEVVRRHVLRAEPDALAQHEAGDEAAVPAFRCTTVPPA